MDQGTILTSIVGASAATIGVVVAKDSKVSEFRQEWIDALREDVSRLCALLLALLLHRDDAKEDKLTLEKDAQGRLLALEANGLSTRIKLRLDLNKPKMLELHNLISDAHQMLHIPEGTFADMSVYLDRVTDKTSEVLDEAWVRVKGGERRFRWTFRFALSTLCLSVIWLLCHWLVSGHHL